MIGVDERLFGGAVEEVFWVAGKILVEWIGRRNQHGQRSRRPAPSAPHLLAGGGDGARVTGEQRCPHAADVDAEFEGVCGYHGTYTAVAQPLLDRAALRRQVAGTVAADGGQAGIGNTGVCISLYTSYLSTFSLLPQPSQQHFHPTP